MNALQFHQEAEFLRQSCLEALCMNGFDEGPGCVIDMETRVKVDLLPGGERLDRGPLRLPAPTIVSEEPQILTLQDLISSKLSAYIGRGIDRAKDYADVVELMKANRVSREYEVSEAVRELYERTWNELHPKPKQ